VELGRYTHDSRIYIPFMNMLEREMASAIFVLPSLLPGTVEDYRVPHNAFEQLNEPEKTKTKIYSFSECTQIYMFFFKLFHREQNLPVF